MDRLMFAVLSDSLAQLRRVPARCGRETPISLEALRAHFAVWERGVLINAACFLLDFPRVSFEIPVRAFRIAQGVLQVEAQHADTDEVVAAAVAGTPWRSRFDNACLRCGQPGTWRSVLEQPGLPIEIGWRYQRPENHIPLCRRCVSRIMFQTWVARFELARALWGSRFEALLRWHHALENNVLPADWDRCSDPLWPAAFGGNSWQSGSGAIAYSEPRPHFGIARTRSNIECLYRYVGQARTQEFLQPGGNTRMPHLDRHSEVNVPVVGVQS